MRPGPLHPGLTDWGGMKRNDACDYEFLDATLRRHLRASKTEAGHPPSIVGILMFDRRWTALRAWRNANGLSCKAVAARLGISVPTYTLIESGDVALCEWMAPLLERSLGIKWSLLRAVGKVPTPHSYRADSDRSGDA